MPESGVIGTPTKVEGGESPGSDPRAYHSESPKKPGLRHKIKFGSFPDHISNMGQQERTSSVTMPDIRKVKGRDSPEAAQGGTQGALPVDQETVSKQ